MTFQSPKLPTRAAQPAEPCDAPEPSPAFATPFVSTLGLPRAPPFVSTLGIPLWRAGKFDFFPSTTGKGNAVAYLQGEFGVSPEESVCLFDDDNDLPMAERCGIHYLPGLTSSSVERAAAEHPEWHVASRAGQGVFAIEECLERLLERVRREQGEAGNEPEAGDEEAAGKRRRVEAAVA